MVSILIIFKGSHGIEPKRDRTHFLKIGFVVAWGGCYSYYKLQCIKLDKENRIQEKKNSFIRTKKHLTQFLKMGSTPFGFNSTPTIFKL